MKKIFLPLIFIALTVLNSHAFGIFNPPSMTTPAFESYAPDPSAVDQGVTDTTNITLKNLKDQIGSINEATIIVHHNASGATTAFVLSTDLTITRNQKMWFENGAIIQISIGATLFIDPASIVASSTQYIFNDLNSDHSGVSITSAGYVSAGWWYDGGGNITSAWQKSRNSVDRVSKIDFVVPGGDYVLGAYGGGDGGASKFRGAENLFIYGWGAEFTSSVSTVVAMELEDLTNCVVEGFTLDGDQSNIGDAGGTPGGSNVQISGCTNVSIIHNKLLNADRDAVLVGVDPSTTSFRSLNITIADNEIVNSGRNGISIVGAIGTDIRNNTFKHIGTDPNSQAPFAAIDLETNEDVVIDTVIDNNYFFECVYALREIDGGSGNVDNTMFSNNWVLADLDNTPQTSYAIFTEDAMDGLTISNCSIQGPVWLNCDNITITKGTQLIATTIDSGSPLRFLGAAGGNIIVENSTISLSGFGTKGTKFIATSTRTDTGAFMSFINNEFSLLSNMAPGSEDLISFAAPATGENHFWDKNRFTTSGVTAVHYLPWASRDFHGTNSFDTFLVPNIGPDTSNAASNYADEILGPIAYGQTVQQRLELSGTSAVITNGLITGSMVWGMKAEVVSGGTVTYASGDNSWQVGTYNDADAFGVQTLDVPGSDLKTDDWTFRFTPTSGFGATSGQTTVSLVAETFATPIIISGTTDILVQPSASTFSGGTVELIFYYNRIR